MIPMRVDPPMLIPDVAAFEALVLTQQPATVPWQPVTPYDFESRKAIEGPHPQLIKDAFSARTVIDIGCGPGHLVRMLRDLDVNAVGVDRSRQTPPLVLQGVINELDITSAPADRQYDLVICREVLEHLTVLQIRQAVQNLCRSSKKFVYVTTRFSPAPQSLLDVATSDDLDPTHISMLNQDLLRVLFVLEGFTRRPDLETQVDWQRLGRCLVYERAV
jgi:SAM-dependent methyltransferase